MSVIILGFWGWLVVCVWCFFYIYISRDTLVVLGLAVCLFLQGGGPLLQACIIIIMRFCFVPDFFFFSSLLVFLLSGILGGGFLGGFVITSVFIIIRIHWWGQWKSIALHVLYHHHHYHHHHIERLRMFLKYFHTFFYLQVTVSFVLRRARCLEWASAIDACDY